MRSSFEPSLKAVLIHEGGYVNHPKDPGGATNKGVTQATYDDWRDKRGLPRRTVRIIDDTEVRAIYKQQYWDAVFADDLPAGVDYATFDFGVNSGPARARTYLKRLVGVRDEPGMTIGTLAKIHRADPVDLIKRLCASRMAFIRGLKTFAVFGKGWTRRISGVEAKAVRMALATQGLDNSEVRRRLDEEAITSGGKARVQKEAAAGAGATGAAGTTGTAFSFDITSPEGMVAVAVLVLITGVVIFALIHKSRVNEQRAAAYLEA